MKLLLVTMLVSVMLIGATNAAYNYKTGSLNAQGVPDGGMDLAPPTFEQMKNFGSANSGDAFTVIMEMNERINTTGLCLLEGDIPVPCNETNRAKRNALRDRGMRWINGVVPYVIDNRYDYGTRQRILRAMERYHTTTCIRFVQRTNQRDYISIFPGNGCYSLVGRVGGMQQVSLGNGCTTNMGTIIHELMHAIGFHHEQTRTDRDNFIYIYFQNIIRGLEYNFDKYEQTYIDHLGTNYDLFSVMHYHMTAFSSNGQPTIVARDQRFRLDYRSDFSSNDINKINIYYECSNTGGGGGGGEVTPAPEETDCMDMNTNCPIWAQYGHCDRNPTWMLANCKLSCEVCDPTTGTGTGSNDCKDMNDNCSFWASVGECDINPSWMLPNCPESCNQCDDTGSVSCMDQNENCNLWARYDQCTINPSYMLEYCPRSCGQCNSNFMSVCEDYHENCMNWANNNQCEENPGYMNYQCRKSCNLCAASSPLALAPPVECQDSTLYCSIYAEDGQCETNPDYMGLMCPDTCQMCPGRNYTVGGGGNGAPEVRSFFGLFGSIMFSVVACRFFL